VQRSRAWLLEVWYRFQEALLPRWQALDRWIDSKFGDEESNKDGALAQKFKPDAEAIEEAPVPISTHAALYMVLTFLVIAILWAVFGTLDRIVVAQGKIATQTPVIVLQPFSTSRIMQLNVKAGDHVRKGQVLVSFDPAFAQADEASLEQKVRALTAEVDRIEAEMSGAPMFAAGPTDGSERQTQAQIFVQEMSQYSAEMAVRDSRVGAIDSQIKADNASIAGLKKQLEMARKVVEIRKYLLSQKAGAPLDVMTAESNEIDFELRLKNMIGDARKLFEQRAEVQAERQTFLDKWRSDHNQQLVQASQNLAEANEALNKARRMKDFTQMNAPVNGVVLEMADRSVGSVLREGETLVTLVPDAADLYVEANVPSRDVSYVKVGNSVRVKLETYPFQKYGTLSGRLDVISPDSIPLKADNDKSELVYRAQVRLTESVRDLTKRGIHLRPGLVATAEIKTGSRSIASYVLNPILRTADEGLREP
jgi:HlyD family secretion protein